MVQKKIPPEVYKAGAEDMIKYQFYPKCFKLHNFFNEYVIPSSASQGIIFIDKYLGRDRFKNLIRKLNYLLTQDISKLFGNDKLEADAFYSTGPVYGGDKKWVLDLFDSPFCLAGYNFGIFKKNVNQINTILERDNLLKIICRSQDHKNVMKRYFSKKVIDKIVIQIPKLPKKKFKKSKKEYFQILFLGSINNPGDFYQKGGGYAVDILEKLQKLYKIKLVIRCALPSEMQERILSNKDIIYYKNKVSQEKMEELYKTSDIAILANQYFVLMTTLEAKAYSLPIIALDTTPMVRELISKKDGFLIKPPEKLKKFYMMEKYPLDNRNPQFVKFLKCKDNRVVNDIANKIKSLMTKKHEKNR